MDIKVLGQRVLVKKEKIDVGGLKLQPETENDGMKNQGEIIAVGDIKEIHKRRGLKKGAKIFFKKFFIANDGTDNQHVFVDVENILGIIK